jgi:hypothetical protein
MIQIANYQQFIKSKGLQKEFENFLQYSPDTTMYLKNKVKNMPSATQAWKDFVNDTDVVENVCRYLDESYDFFREECFFPEGDRSNVFKEKIGKLGSAEWKDFQYLVIENLKNDGCFNQLEDKEIFDDDFEDSASGCDEIVQGKAFDVLHKLLDIN